MVPRSSWMPMTRRRALSCCPALPSLRERLATLLQARALRRSGWVQGEAERRDPLVAIEGGEPLARAPLVAHALTALRLLTGASAIDGVSAWLCAPYWR